MKSFTIESACPSLAVEGWMCSVAYLKRLVNSIRTNANSKIINNASLNKLTNTLGNNLPHLDGRAKNTDCRYHESGSEGLFDMNFHSTRLCFHMYRVRPSASCSFCCQICF